MGNEFLFKKSGKLRKCRERKKKSLESELPPTVVHESLVSAKLICNTSVEEGDHLEVCVSGEQVEVFKSRNKIAFIPNMRTSLKDTIRRSGGRVVGRVDHKMTRSNQLAIAIMSNEQERTSDGQTSAKTASAR